MPRLATQLAIMSLLLVAGCATALPQIPIGVERIEFDPQGPPFCGRCEHTKLVATADGGVWIEQGRWAGSYRDWRVSRRYRQVTPQEFARFRDRLARYKPDVDSMPLEGACKSFISDNGGAIVTSSQGDRVVKRVFDFGCLDDRVMNVAVGNAASEQKVA